jgi:cyanophycinase-like exopeptidase
VHSVMRMRCLHLIPAIAWHRLLSLGDQWQYYSMWKQTPMGNAIASHINNSPIGGTSAGMAVLGQVWPNAHSTRAALRDSCRQPVALC